MPEEPNLKLEEWKARYDSYKLYRGQYLTTLSIVLTAIILAFGLATSKAMTSLGRRFILGSLPILLLGLVVAHAVALDALANLARRISDLESALAFVEFQTTAPLQRAVKATLALSTIGLFISIAAYILLNGLTT
jgi:cadmium resistance protein CadD (predicted permease)